MLDLQGSESGQLWTTHFHSVPRIKRGESQWGNRLFISRLAVATANEPGASFPKLFGWSITDAGPAAIIDTQGGSPGINGHITALGHEPSHYTIFYVQVDDIPAGAREGGISGGQDPGPAATIRPGRLPGSPISTAIRSACGRRPDSAGLRGAHSSTFLGFWEPGIDGRQHQRGQRGAGKQAADDYRGQRAWISALRVVAIAMGMNPKPATRAVIRIGRSRTIGGLARGLWGRCPPAADARPRSPRPGR